MPEKINSKVGVVLNRHVAMLGSNEGSPMILTLNRSALVPKKCIKMTTFLLNIDINIYRVYNWTYIIIVSKI